MMFRAITKQMKALETPIQKKINKGVVIIINF